MRDASEQMCETKCDSDDDEDAYVERNELEWVE